MVREEKIKKVEELREMIEKYPVIGILNMYKMPAPQLQEIKLELSGKAKIKMGKKSLMIFALKKSKKKDFKELEKKIRGQPAFIFTDMNPFKLFKYLKKNKSPAPAKAGDIAQNDIFIKQGNTGLPPGPAIGLLQNYEVKTTVKEGKINVVKDVKAAKKGDMIEQDLANLLGMLNMKPMSIGLDLVAAYEDEIIFDKVVLDINEEEYLDKIKSIVRQAVNLSVNTAYPTKFTISLIINKAFREAKAVAVEAEILEKDVIKDLIVKAKNQAVSLKSLTG